MFNAKVMISSVFVFTLIGCGGGGDSETASTSNNETDIDEQVTVETPAEATVDMSELKASDDFDFTSKEQIEVSFDISDVLADNEKTGSRAYVSVYSDYTLLDSGQYYSNGSSRVVAGDLQDGAFNSSFTSLNDQSTYLIEVWFYNGDDPLQSVQSIVDNSLTW